MFKHVGRGAALVLFVSTYGCKTQPEPAPDPSTSTANSARAAATNSAVVAAPSAAASSSAANAPEPSPDTFIDSVSWAPSGDRLAAWCISCSYPGDAMKAIPVPYHIADLPSGAVRTATIDVDGDYRSIKDVVFSDKGTFVTVSTRGVTEVVKVVDFAKVHRDEALTLYGHAAVSPDEGFVASADSFGSGNVLDLATDKPVSGTSLHDSAASETQQLAWIPASSRVVFGCDHACTPELWGTSGKRIAKLKVAGSDWNLSKFVTTSDKIAVADTNGLVAVFDAKDGKGSVLRKKYKVKTPEEALIGSVALAVSGDGKKLVMGHSRGDLIVWDLETSKAVTVFAAKEGAASIGDIVVSYDGSLIAYSGADSWMEVRAAEGATPMKISGNPRVYAVDGTLIVHDKDRIAGLVGGKEKWRRLVTIPADSPVAGRVALSKDGKIVAIPDGQLHLVRASDGKTITLALENKGGKRALVPQAGVTAAELTALLGK